MDAQAELREADLAMQIALHDRERAILQALDAGVTQQAIADATGLTQGRIAQIKSRALVTA